MKEEKTFNKSDLKNAKRSAIGGGIALGALATLGIGVLLKKTTNANIVDGSENILNKGYSKIKNYINSKRNKTDEELVSEEESDE